MAGVAVVYLGRRAAVPNAVLWSLFPFFHAGHEFAEFAFEFVPQLVWIERLEIFFAVGSSFALLAAAIEYNGAVSSPAGKISMVVADLFLAYLVAVLPDEGLEALDQASLFFLGMYTSPARFLQGFVLVFASAMVLLLTYWSLSRKSSKLHLSVDSRLKKTTAFGIVALLFYSTFEGVESSVPAFVIFRAVTLALVVVVPLVIVATTKLGLQHLMVVDAGGLPIFAYDFADRKPIDLRGEEGSHLLLVSGFLAAIQSFSSEVLKTGRTIAVTAQNSYFVLHKREKRLYALQSLTYAGHLDEAVESFASQVDPTLEGVQVDGTGAELSRLGERVEAAFRAFL